MYGIVFFLSFYYFYLNLICTFCTIFIINILMEENFHETHWATAHVTSVSTFNISVTLMFFYESVISNVSNVEKLHLPSPDYAYRHSLSIIFQTSMSSFVDFTTYTVKLLIQAGSQIEAGSLIQAGGPGNLF